MAQVLKIIESKQWSATKRASTCAQNTIMIFFNHRWFGQQKHDNVVLHNPVQQYTVVCGLEKVVS